MAVSLRMKLRRALAAIVEDPKTKPSHRLKASNQLLVMLKLEQTEKRNRRLNKIAKANAPRMPHKVKAPVEPPPNALGV